MAKKYVEAEKVRASMMYNGFRAPDMTVTEFVDDLPAADVVEVVRCRDCKNYHTDTRCEMFPDQNDYCSYGERK